MPPIDRDDDFLKAGGGSVFRPISRTALLVLAAVIMTAIALGLLWVATHP